MDLWDSFHSEMVHKIGPLKMKGLTGYREYFAVLTMDKYLYLFNKGDEDGRASYTMYVGEGETHPRPEVCAFAWRVLLPGICANPLLQHSLHRGRLH